MRRWRFILMPSLLIILLITVSFLAVHGAEEGYPAGDGLLDPFAQAQALGKGVNFGNLLDAKPNEGAWTNGLVIKESHFDLAKAAGFDSIRIPIRFSGHAGKNAPYTINNMFFKRVDQVVGWGLAKGLRIVITMHHYEEIHQKPEAHRRRFVEMWKQIAARYKDYPDELYYEILNEPSQQLTAGLWNDILAECLREIRRIDSHHTVVVGCVNWSNVDGLEDLELPAEETNAIVTFHYYTPTLFCFQDIESMGRDWATKGIIWPGPPESPLKPARGVGSWVTQWINDYNTIADPDLNPAGPGVIEREILIAAFWGFSNERPLWMSEFTVQDGADMASRVNWISFVRQKLEEYNIPWSFWTLVSDVRSHLYDVKRGRWIEPLTEALGLEVK